MKSEKYSLIKKRGRERKSVREKEGERYGGRGREKWAERE